MESIDSNVKEAIKPPPAISPSRLLEELQFDGDQLNNQSPSNANPEESDDDIMEAMLVSQLNRKENSPPPAKIEPKVVVEENNAEISQVFIVFLCVKCLIFVVLHIALKIFENLKN